MKLRNKKTGEIKRVEFLADYQTDDGTEIGFRICGSLDVCSYTTLKELNEEWEDYEPKQPLIKDEKVRKAVRAWADLFGYKFVTHRFYTTTTGHRWSLLTRESQEICLPDLDGLDESKDYTIAELCGEEE